MRHEIYKKIIYFTMFFLIINLGLASSLPALAGDSNTFWGGSNVKEYVRVNSGLPAEQNVNNPVMVVTNIIRIVLGFLGILAVLIVLFAGFKWMTSGGSEDKISEAKKMLSAGLIGLIIILCAFILVNFVLTIIYRSASGT